MKVRERPLIFEAYRYDGTTRSPGICVCGPHQDGPGVWPHVHNEGAQAVHRGDYLVRVAGRWTVVDAPTFEAQYEEVIE